jgi:hypothetical protein
MRLVSLFAASVTALFFTGNCQATVIEGPLVDPANGHSYYITAPGSWMNAQQQAEALGGNLVTIRNAAENAWIVSNLLVDFSSSTGPNLTATPLWIGFHDPFPGDGNGAQHAADFVWADGESVTYTNWFTNQPDNNANLEYYGTINWPYAAGQGGLGTWNDTELFGSVISPPFGVLTSPYYGIAEVLPEPTSLGLVMIASAALLRRKRRSTSK